MTELHHLKRLPEDQIEAASRVAARALQNDPLSVFYYPDPIERKKSTILRCEIQILAGFLSGEVYTTSNSIEGVSVWIPHGIKEKKKENPSKDIVKKLRKIRRELALDPLFTEKLNKVNEIFVSLHTEQAPFPHWLLVLLAVDPSQQGKGYSSMLVRPKLSESDKQNLPSYLNTQNEINLPIYEHFGFELIGKRKIPNSDFHFHGMLRNKKK